MAIRSDVYDENAKKERISTARKSATVKPSAAPENEPTNEEPAASLPESSASTLAYKASNVISSNISLSKQGEDDLSSIALDQYQGITSRVLETTRDNVGRAAMESIEKLPIFTEALNSFQLFNIQAYKEVAEIYIEVQRQLISSIQTNWVPYWEKTLGLYWKSFMSPQRLTELYGFLVAGFADGLILANRTFSIYFLENFETLQKNMEKAERTSNDLAKARMNLTKIELDQTDSSRGKSKVSEDEVATAKTISELDT
jgi:hypothetical protein